MADDDAAVEYELVCGDRVGCVFPNMRRPRRSTFIHMVARDCAAAEDDCEIVRCRVQPDVGAAQFQLMIVHPEWAAGCAFASNGTVSNPFCAASTFNKFQLSQLPCLINVDHYSERWIMVESRLYEPLRRKHYDGVTPSDAIELAEVESRYVLK
jgi:hypothetical protein